MCFGALIHARVGRVVFGAPDPKVGVSRWPDTLDGANLNHRFAFEGGLLEPECREQLQAFFRRRRGLGSVPSEATWNSPGASR